MLGLLLCGLGACALVWGDDAMVAKGEWLTESVGQCPDPDNYPWDTEIKKRKLNRTHDVFSAKLEILEDISEESHGVYIQVCKKVDGGCKLQYTFDEISFCKFVKKYAEDNFRHILANAGYEEEYCPVPKKSVEIIDFLFNYEELPEKCLVGKFKAYAYLTKGSKRLACVMVDLEFRETEGDNDDDDDDDDGDEDDQ